MFRLLHSWIKWEFEALSVVIHVVVVPGGRIVSIVRVRSGDEEISVDVLEGRLCRNSDVIALGVVNAEISEEKSVECSVLRTSESPLSFFPTVVVVVT